jgi:hypothetical protein
MNKKLSRGLVVSVMTIVILVAFSGCIEEEKETNITVEILKMMPGESESLTVFNLKAMREEPNLKEYYYVLTEETQALILPYEDIDLVGACASSSGKFLILILKGTFGDTDIETARGECEKVEYYKDAEIWTECGGYYSEVDSRVILDELVMLCEAENQESVKMAIDTIEGIEKSVYDSDEYVRDVVNRLLPNGITTTIMKESYYSVPHSVAMGFTAVKDKGGTVKFKMVIKFENKEDAAEYGKEVMEEFDKEEMEISDLEMKQDNEFVEITGKLPTENLSKFLGHSS